MNNSFHCLCFFVFFLNPWSAIASLLCVSVFLQGDVSRGAASMSVERGGGGAPLRQCNISLPDGSCCSVPLRAGVSIRDLLLGLCEKLCINLAAIDLFLVGGEKVQH